MCILIALAKPKGGGGGVCVWSVIFVTVITSAYSKQRTCTSQCQKAYLMLIFEYLMCEGFIKFDFTVLVFIIISHFQVHLHLRKKSFCLLW